MTRSSVSAVQEVLMLKPKICYPHRICHDFSQLQLTDANPRTLINSGYINLFTFLIISEAWKYYAVNQICPQWNEVFPEKLTVAQLINTVHDCSGTDILRQLRPDSFLILSKSLCF